METPLGAGYYTGCRSLWKWVGVDGVGERQTGESQPGFQARPATASLHDFEQPLLHQPPCVSKERVGEEGGWTDQLALGGASGLQWLWFLLFILLLALPPLPPQRVEAGQVVGQTPWGLGVGQAG